VARREQNMLALGDREIETKGFFDLVVGALLSCANVDEVEQRPSKAERSTKL
jgi:hypothetical protein